MSQRQGTGILREVPRCFLGQGSQQSRVPPLPPTGSCSHSPEAPQDGHVAQRLREHSQGGVFQREVAEAAGGEARADLALLGLGPRCRARPIQGGRLRPQCLAMPRDCQDGHCYLPSGKGSHAARNCPGKSKHRSAEWTVPRAIQAAVVSESRWAQRLIGNHSDHTSRVPSGPSPALGATWTGGSVLTPILPARNTEAQAVTKLLQGHTHKVSASETEPEVAGLPFLGPNIVLLMGPLSTRPPAWAGASHNSNSHYLSGVNSAPGPVS